MAYVLPFVLFLFLIGVQNYLPVPQPVEFAAQIAIVAVAIGFVLKRIDGLAVSSPVTSVVIGLGVFVIWVAPDALFPGYRGLWPFSNPVMGAVRSSLSAASASDPLALTLRSIRAVAIVPVVEELFWRGWLMRYIIRPDFEKVAIGTYARGAFWIVAVLFAAEHGPYWDVGLVTGAIYNAWVCRTKRLGDLIVTHAVTNLALCLYIISTHKWEFWL